MRTRTVSLLLLLLIAGCESDGDRQYIDDLSAMIRKSDRIIVTEHSSWLDAHDVESRTSPLPEQVVYATRELSQAQRQTFLHTIERLDPTPEEAPPACIPEIHHTVHFYASGELLSKMEICFECGQVMWEASKAAAPSALSSGLASFIEDIGLEPERDWDALAKKHARVQRE